MITPYDTESVLLGELLTYEEAARTIIPELTFNRFIYGMDGSLGGTEHSKIYQAMTTAFLRDKKPPTIANILPLIDIGRDGISEYLQSLVGRLKGQYGVLEFDKRGLMGRATTVDKQAVVYHVALKAARVGELAKDDEAFAKFVGKIDDVDAWTNKVLADFRTDLRGESNGYTHIAALVDGVKERWRGIRSGEVSLLLPSGMPSLAARALPPAGKLMIVHGMSSGGKSVLVHLINLGTALGLYKDRIKGCVAINSLEESREEVLEKWAFTLAGVDSLKLYGGKDSIPKEDWRRLEEWIELVGQLPIYIDGTNALTSSVMEYRLNGLHDGDKGPVWQMSADYIELFGTEDVSEDNREQQLAAVTDTLFQISRQLGTCVIVISQSTFSGNKYYIAGPMGTRNSRSILHRADVLLEVWNPIELEKAGYDFKTPPNLDNFNVWVLIQKYRRGPKGDPIGLTWEPKYTRMLDPMLNTGIGGSVLFSHLEEVKKMMTGSKHLVPAVADTPLGDF